ncbi:MAG: hypothetical protein QOE75_831 [Solirubrobacterales bacterium]|nr:hypothetical protein [Solirubrobacterales bacterium]
MKRLLLVAVVLALSAWSVPSAGAAEFKTYVGCGLSREALPSDVCYLGDGIGAFFRVDGADVEYDVCVEFPGGGYLCAEDQPAHEGTLYVNSIASEVLGSHRVEWYVEDAMIATWSFDLEAEPPPPPPVVPPPTTLAPAIPSGPSDSCNRARGRVRWYATKLKWAEGSRERARFRSKLRWAKALVKTRC